MSAPEIRVKNSPVRCPYCKDTLEEVREVVACAKCGARHHASCRAEHGRCAVCSSRELLIYSGEPASDMDIRLVEIDHSALDFVREDEELVYRWRVLTKENMQLVYKEAFVRLGPRELSFTALWNRSFYVAKGDKLRVREVAIRGGRLYVAFAEGQEVAVATESIGSVLSRSDIERLENAILNWLRT